MNYSKMKINSLLFILFLFIPIVTVPIKLITNSGWIVWLSTILIILISLYLNKTYINSKFYIIFGSISLLFLINVLVVSYRNEVVFQITEFGKFAFVPILLGIAKMNFKKVMEYWYYLSLITILLFTFYINNNNVGYMFFGTSVSLAYAGVLYQLFEKKRLFDVLILVYSGMLVLLFGNRGSLLTIIILTIIWICAKAGKKVKITIVVVSLVFIIMHFMDLLIPIASIIKSILLKLNLYSYNMNKIIVQLQNGLSSVTSGRDKIYFDAWQLIKNAWFLPMGLGYYQSKGLSSYPHNLFLDLFLIFGFFSVIIIIFIIISLIKFYKHQNDVYKQDVVTFLITISLTRLMFSGTFISSTPFWMWIIIIYDNKLNKLEKNNALNNFMKFLIK